MRISVRGASEHNLKNINAVIEDGLTVVTGVSGSGKTSLVFDTLYHEARRRFLEVYATGSVTRLSPANVESIEGLGPAVAVGQNILNRNPNSTLATAAGLHPFLRLLYTHYSRRTCPECGSEYQYYGEDALVELIRSWASVERIPLLARIVHQGMGSHSHLMSGLADLVGSRALLVDGEKWNGDALEPASAHSIDVDVGTIPMNGGAVEIRRMLEKVTSMGVILIVVTVENESHLISSAPVCGNCGAWIEDLSPEDFHQSCSHCEGRGCPECFETGLVPRAALAFWMGHRLPELLHRSVDELAKMVEAVDDQHISPRLRKELSVRIQALQKVGLGYLTLSRPSPTLSRGEAQRVRLAVTFTSRLEDLIHVLDEPTIGLHPADTHRLVNIFRNLPGPVIVVEHDRVVAAQADHILDIGPGAGEDGGHLVYEGSATGLWVADTPTGHYFSLRKKLSARSQRRPADGSLEVFGANLRNLKSIDVAFPLGRMTVVTGVSGSGKSTLVEDVLVASLEKQIPVGCTGLGKSRLKPVMIDQSPIGRNPRSNPATYTGLADVIRDFFSQATGLSASHFSFNRKEGECPECNGLGAIEVSMRYLPPTWITCQTCGGDRFNEEVLGAWVEIDGKRANIAQFLNMRVDEVLSLFRRGISLPNPKQQAGLRILQAMHDIGLGYLPLGQPSTTLSGGEAQRIKLARYLGQKSLEKQLLVMDEPSSGLHPQDLKGLLSVLNRLVESGATIVVVEHNLDIVRAADWVIDLGPGSGPDGGKLLYAGPVDGLERCAESRTAAAMAEEKSVQPRIEGEAFHQYISDQINIRGARLHNLKNIDVAIPKQTLTVVTGVSGSGKSSLVSDILESEARRRYLETLSLYERQGTKEESENDVDSITGLGVTLTAAPEKLTYSRRSTVGTATEITRHLAVLLASSLERDCIQCGGSMVRGQQTWTCENCGASGGFLRPLQFSGSVYSAACLTCHGVGSLNIPQPEKLIVAPEKPLLDGAMYSPGFFPKGYLGKPLNHGYYLTMALAERFGFDPFTTPWKDMTEAAQRAFLFGDPTPMVVTFTGHSGRTFTAESKYPGFYGFITDWDVGNTYTDNVPCPDCQGSRLRPEMLSVKLDGWNIHKLSQATLRELHDHLKGYGLPSHVGRVEASSFDTLLKRLYFLVKVGLGYLNLYRPVGTLSAGEVQRIRLASLLNSGLTSLTIVLDEPTRGLHAVEVDALVETLASLRDEGHTVVVVEHEPAVMRAADFLIDMGPGAGTQGGELVACGKPQDVSLGPGVTAAWLRGERSVATRQRRAPQQWLTIAGAVENNLHGDLVRVPLNMLAGICGVSGSGKSTLVIDTLGRYLAPRKQTTSVAYEPVAPGKFDRIDGAPARTFVVDQSKSGIFSPASYLGLNQIFQQLFAESESAHNLGINADMLSRACSTCRGRGQITLDMAFLPDIHVPCEVCKGSGYQAEAWQVSYRGYTLPEVFTLTVEETLRDFGDDERLRRPLQSAVDVGLGYLVLRQPGYSLSGGEAQRLKIALELSKRALKGALYILDEPTIGQHLEDVCRLNEVLHRLVDEGGSCLVVEHNPYLLASCDWLIELGPGGGPDGGHIIASGTPEDLAAGDTPSARCLREVLNACH